MSEMRAAKLRVQQASNRQPGELARIKVVQGPDYGHVYVLNQPRASIGRGEDAVVMIGDLKASRLHAEISRSSSGSWTVKDLGSANGILVNGRSVSAAILKAGDTVSIGETILEFTPGDAGTVALAMPARSLEQIRRDLGSLEKQKEKVKSLGRAQRAPVKSDNTDSNQRAKVLGLVAVAVGLYVFVFDDSAKKPASIKRPPAVKQEAMPSVGSIADGEQPTEISQSAEQFMREGLWEFRERNWLRARQSFENVLQLDQNHALAKKYRADADAAIEREVKDHLRKGNRAYQSGNFKSAKGHFEAVQRLKFRDANSDAFKEAKEGLEKTEQAIKRTGGRS